MELISAKEASERYQVSVATISQWAIDNGLDKYRKNEVGMYYDAAELAKIANREAGPLPDVAFDENLPAPGDPVGGEWWKLDEHTLGVSGEYLATRKTKAGIYFETSDRYVGGPNIKMWISPRSGSPVFDVVDARAVAAAVIDIIQRHQEAKESMIAYGEDGGNL